MTGLELYRLFQNSIDKPYTDYVSPTLANRWLNISYIKVLQDIYNERLINQNAYDELSYLISISQSFGVNQTTNTIFHKPIPIVTIGIVGADITVTTDLEHDLTAGDTVVIDQLQATGIETITLLNGVLQTVTTTPTTTTFTFTASFAPVGAYTANTGIVKPTKGINDYYHYLYAEATFLSPYYNSYITDSTNTTPIRATINNRTTLRDSDYILISSITGNTATNGRRYVKQLNNKLYSLYSDKNLQTPIAGNGVQTGYGVIKQIITNPLRFKRSDEKGSVYGLPTVKTPFFQQGKLKFYILPNDVPCETLQIDYIRIPPRQIDVANDTIEWLNFYPLYFLTKIAYEGGRSFSFAARDGNLTTGLTEQILEQN